MSTSAVFSSADVARVADGFEEAWRNGGRPRIEDWLPEAVGRRAVLPELVHLDLEYRLRTGEAVAAVEYLRRFPELAENRAVLLDLLDAEAALRRPCEGAAPTRPACLGAFELFEPLGAGAFGTVYKARDTRLGRLVAVKLPRSDRLRSAHQRERFLREARNLGRLHHPGIVAVYEANVADDGSPYLVTEWVSGQDLRQRLAEGRLPVRQSAEVVAALAEAVHHAHGQGVIHRDLKPSNVLLGPEGRPRLTDFGLARGGPDDATLTADGEVLGTPAYMPPEQARGDARRVDGRGDVYSLGVILYELLTGEVPFRGNPRRVLEQVLAGEPRPPRQLDDRVPADLEAVCLKAMAVEPACRYATAAALSDDLRRFLGGLPTHARPLGPVRRVWRRCRRRPLLSALVAALVVVSVAGFMLVTWQWQRADAQRRLAEANFACAHEAVGYFTWLLTCRSEMVGSAELRPLRKEALEKNVTFHRRLRQQRPDDPEVGLSLGRALTSLGHVYRDEPGGLAEAERHYREAAQVFEELCAARSDDRIARCELAGVHGFLGAVQSSGGRRAEAIASLERSRAEYHVLFRTPDTAPNASVLSGVRQTCAALNELYRDGSRTDSRDNLPSLLEAAADLLEAQSRASGSDPSVEHVQTLHLLGTIQRDRGRPDLALAVHRKELPLAEALARAAPSDPAMRRLLAVSLLWLARAQDETGDSGEALRSYQECARRLEQWAEEGPEPWVLGDLATVRHSIGNVHSDAGRPADAAESYGAAAALRERLLTTSSPWRAHEDVSGTWRNLGQELRLLGKSEEARAAFRREREHLCAALALVTDSPALRKRLALCEERLGERVGTP